MKIAIIHDWLVVNGGAEKVLREIIEVYPTADLFTLVDFLPEVDRSWLKNVKIKSSFIQKLPMARTKYRNYFPLFSIAIEQFDLSAFDLVISSSYSVAKGVITGPNQTHICYCHSPARYAWDLQEQYLIESDMQKGFKSVLARYFLHKFRIWDVRTANAVDFFVANSEFIKKRIFKCYRRKAEVIYPPVDVARFQLQSEKSDFYLAASRLVPYKKIDLIVEAFSLMPDKKLKVIGDGPQMKKIIAIAQRFSNIEILGYQNDKVMVEHMQKAKAFVFAAEEDFGIIPVEAQACGTPVIAFGKGGCLETVQPNASGIHFKEQTTASLIDAVNLFENKEVPFEAAKIRENAELFSIEAFRSKLMEFVESSVSKDL
jgi:glycosyltransferase involved in cell wall biosynthesis